MSTQLAVSLRNKISAHWQIF